MIFILSFFLSSSGAFGDVVVSSAETYDDNITTESGICLVSDGIKKQPLVYNINTNSLVYPSASCSSFYMGEFFKGNGDFFCHVREQETVLQILKNVSKLCLCPTIQF